MPDTAPRVEPNSLQLRLQHPARGLISVEQLAGGWFDQTIWVRLGGVAGLARDFNLLNHFRRSLGEALGAGASPEASATHPPSPCPWEPPCPLDVLFREQMRVEGVGLPKPFVTLADTDGADLIAGLRVFGFATDWMPTVEHAFVDALCHRLPWTKRLRIAPPPVLDRWIETCEGLDAVPTPIAVTLDWTTPLDAENLDASAKTGSVLTRLHRRLQGLARWHDAALPQLHADAVEHWEMAADASAMDAPKMQAARSGLQRKTFFADSMRGALRLCGNLAPFWPMLQMGERCCVGRGAVRGMGRFVLR